MKRSFTASAEQSDGTTADIRLEVGPLTKAEGPLPPGFDQLRSVCEPDPQRDALVPAAVTSTNTTKDFAATLFTELQTAGEPDSSATRLWTVQMAVGYGDGAACEHDISILRSQDVAPGESSTFNVVFVFHDVYSPESPNGDIGVWADTSVYVKDIECLTGPGAFNGRIPFFEADVEVPGDPAVQDIDVTGVEATESCAGEG